MDPKEPETPPDAEGADSGPAAPAGTEGAPPRSMRSFDYFSSGAHPAAVVHEGVLPEALEAQVEAADRARRAATAGAVTATLLVAVSTWFLWGFRDELAYAFSPSRPPLVLGDVVELTPADIPHNAYVEVSGITEHRGITEKRGMRPFAREYWYFRLVGSRGVFLETPPDKDRYGPITSLTVSGRAVDPARSADYERFLKTYRERFNAEPQAVARVIQVGVKPGEGRLPFAAFIAFIGVLAAFDVWTLVAYARHRRQAAGLLR